MEIRRAVSQVSCGHCYLETFRWLAIPYWFRPSGVTWHWKSHSVLLNSLPFNSAPASSLFWVSYHLWPSPFWVSSIRIRWLSPNWMEKNNPSSCSRKITISSSPWLSDSSESKGQSGYESPKSETFKRGTFFMAQAVVRVCHVHVSYCSACNPVSTNILLHLMCDIGCYRSGYIYLVVLVCHVP